MSDAGVELKPGLQRPRWLIGLAYGVVCTLAVCIPAWPGHMNYDGLLAYRFSIEGIQNTTWPPMHAYLFWLSRHAGAGVGGLFAAQTFALFASAGLAASLLVAQRRLAVAAMGLFAVAFVIVPPMFGVAMAHWRDVTVASFAMASLALWLLAARYRCHGLLIAAAAALGLSVSLRYNAFPLFALTAPLMVWRPFLAPRPALRSRAVAAIALAASVALAWASTEWRLPDFKHPPRGGGFGTTQLFDLLGISACAGRDFVPLAITDGWRLSDAQLDEVYDPRHVNKAFEPHPGVPKVLPMDAYGRVQSTWRQVVPKQLGCYVAHRNAVLVEQMGMARGEVFYPAHGRIDPNDYGIKLANPRLSGRLSTWVAVASAQPWRRPALLYLGAAVVVLLLALRRDPRSLLATALLGGAFANVALLYLIGPAADARYIFPSNVLAAFLIAAGSAMLAERRLRPTRDLSP